jgi:hypothetical protein
MNGKTEKFITGDKYLDFVIEKYDEIIAINELLGRAQSNLPGWVNLHVKQSILELQRSFFNDLNLECKCDEDEIFWFDKKLYNEDSGEGVYFGTELEGFGWKTITAQARDDGGWIYIYLGIKDSIPKKKKDELIKSWQNHLEANKKKLISEGIVLHPDEEDGQYLGAYYLLESVSLSAIREGRFPDQMIQAVKRVTEISLPVLRSFKI